MEKYNTLLIQRGFKKLTSLEDNIELWFIKKQEHHYLFISPGKKGEINCQSHSSVDKQDLNWLIEYMRGYFPQRNRANHDFSDFEMLMDHLD